MREPEILRNYENFKKQQDQIHGERKKAKKQKVKKQSKTSQHCSD